MKSHSNNSSNNNNKYNKNSNNSSSNNNSNKRSHLRLLRVFILQRVLNLKGIRVAVRV